MALLAEGAGIGVVSRIAGLARETCAAAAAEGIQAGVLTVDQTGRITLRVDRATVLAAMSPLAQVSEGTTDSERAELLLAAGEAAFRGGRVAEARQDALEVHASAVRLGAPDLVRRLALSLDPTGDEAWDTDLYAWCSEALTGVEDEPTRIRLLARQTRTALYLNRAVAADETSADALRAAEAIGDPELIAEALSVRQLACSGPDHVDLVADLAGRMVGLGVASRRVDLEMWGHLWAIDSHWYRGELNAISEALPQLRRCTDQVVPMGRWHLLVTRAALAGSRAQFEPAERLVEEARELLEEIGHPAGRGASLSLRLILGHHRGHDEALLSPEIWDFGTDAKWALFSGLARAFALLDSGRADEAAAAYARCGSPAQWQLYSGARLVAYGIAAQVAAGLGREADTRWLRDQLEPYRGLHIVGGAGATTFLGPVELTLGKCAASLGESAGATQDLATASQRAGDRGAPGFRVEAECELARVLLASGQPREARRLALDALPIATALGMTPWVVRLATLAESPGERLSVREREVAELVAEGLTNRAIAKRLVIAERTAENHVQHILTKLDFENRAQIAAWVSGKHSGRHRA